MGIELTFDEKVVSNQQPSDQANLVHVGTRGAVRLE